MPLHGHWHRVFRIARFLNQSSVFNRTGFLPFPLYGWEVFLFFKTKVLGKMASF